MKRIVTWTAAGLGCLGAIAAGVGFLGQRHMDRTGAEVERTIAASTIASAEANLSTRVDAPTLVQVQEIWFGRQTGDRTQAGPSQCGTFKAMLPTGSTDHRYLVERRGQPDEATHVEGQAGWSEAAWRDICEGDLVSRPVYTRAGL